MEWPRYAISWTIMSRYLFCIYIREYIHSGRTTCGAHMQKGTINFRCAAHVSLYSPFAAPLRVHWWRAISLSFIFAEAWLIRNTYVYVGIRTFSSVKCPFMCAYVRAADYSYQHCLRCVRTSYMDEKKKTHDFCGVFALYICASCVLVWRIRFGWEFFLYAVYVCDVQFIRCYHRYVACYFSYI